MSYFVITSNEVGINISEFEDRAKIERAVDIGAFGGKVVYMDRIPPIEKGHFRIDFDGVLIIRGLIVEPKALTTITQWKVP